MESSGSLFHLLITLYEKKNLRTSVLQCGLRIFSEWPLVDESAATSKNVLYGMPVGQSDLFLATSVEFYQERDKNQKDRAVRGLYS